MGGVAHDGDGQAGGGAGRAHAAVVPVGSGAGAGGGGGGGGGGARRRLRLRPPVPAPGRRRGRRTPAGPGAADHDGVSRRRHRPDHGRHAGGPGHAAAAGRLAAARADGWNRWGGDTTTFAASAERVRQALDEAGRPPGAFAFTWGGLAVLADTAAGAKAKRDRLGGDRPGLVSGGPSEV